MVEAVVYIVLVTGSRDWKDVDKIREDIQEQQRIAYLQRKPILVVHGGARGADSIAEKVCEKDGIHTAIVNARWHTYGKRGGPERNKIMAAMYEYDAVLSYPLESSVGTKHMMSIARTK